MGNLFTGGDDQPQIQNVALPAPNEMNVQELQEASVAPITETEAALFTPTGKACCWKDSGEYAFRLRQLEIINYAVKKLSEELWKEDTFINFQTLHRDVMTYKEMTDEQEIEVPNHEWSMVAEDPTFKPMELTHNRFKEFQDYFTTKAGAAKDVMKKDFTTYMTLFRRIRDSLIKTISPQEICRDSGPYPEQQGGRGRYKRRRSSDYRRYSGGRARRRSYYRGY